MTAPPVGAELSGRARRALAASAGLLALSALALSRGGPPGAPLLRTPRRRLKEAGGSSEGRTDVDGAGNVSSGVMDTGVWGFDLGGMDLATLPGQDFYMYANGNWQGRTAIPRDQSSWSAFGALDQLTVLQLHALLRDSAASGASQTGRLFRSYMDEERVEALGAAPLEPALLRVRQLDSHAAFAAHVGSSNGGFGSSPFALYVGADPKDPETLVLQLDQAGLGLPSREYYLEPEFASVKAAYQENIATLLRLAGWPDPDAAAAGVVSFEQRVAQVSWTAEDQRDSDKTYNKMAAGDLTKKAPGFDWPAFFGAAGAGAGSATLIVGAYNETAADDGVPGIARVINSTDLAALKAWAAYNIVSGAAHYLPEAFVRADFNFSGKTLQGQEEMKPRWKRAVGVVNGILGDALGQEYVAKYFPESSKAIMDGLTEMLREAFSLRLQRVQWMTNETKAKALEKLASFKFEVGYPKKFHNFSALEVLEGDLFGNVERAAALAWQRELEKLGKPIDHDYWSMPPQTVNAYFDNNENKCVFLAGILQPPFFDPKADMSVNFGGIGAVIGHEMTHGFDDEGRKYDAKGRLSDWWTPADAAEFERRAHAYGEQFEQFQEGIPAGMHIRPGLTMGENIADLGGLNIAHEAYHLWLQRNAYKPLEPLLSAHDVPLEGDRRFFAGWAQVWRAKYTDGSLRQSLTSDPHSPGQARATIAPRNIDRWYDAFGIQPGEPMFLSEAQRVQIW